MKIVAMMRVKDAMLTIRECLTNLSRLVDEIVIVDNGSTDGTLEVYKEFPKVVTIEHTEGFHEGRDKNLALKLARDRKPDWIMWLDSDEIFEQYADKNELMDLMRNETNDLIAFRLFNFHLSTTKFRFDGSWRKYATYPQPRLWRDNPNCYFRNVSMHAGNIENLSNQSILISRIRVKHYTLITCKQATTKGKVYNSTNQEHMHYKTSKAFNGFIPIYLPWIENANPLFNSFFQKIFELFSWMAAKHDAVFNLLKLQPYL